MRLDWIDALFAIVIAIAVAVMIFFKEPAKKSKKTPLAPVVEEKDFIIEEGDEFIIENAVIQTFEDLDENIQEDLPDKDEKKK